jgi:prepilin-type N-terminal cleavage/methylation domain-containing protein
MNILIVPRSGNISAPLPPLHVLDEKASKTANVQPATAFRSHSSQEGFTLVELIMVIATIAILGTGLTSALSLAKAKGTLVSCLHNQEQMALAALIYSADFDNKWVANNSGDDDVDITNPPANYRPSVWVQNLNPIREQGKISERVSLLAPYMNKVKASFKCPGDRLVHIFNGQTYTYSRSYAMNTFVGWTPVGLNSTLHNEPAGYPNSTFMVYKKTTEGKPSEYFLFGEVHPFSICRPQFGTHPGATAQGLIYHLPGNYHIQASTFSFGDGHAEAHRWVNRLFNNPRMLENDYQWHNHEIAFASFFYAPLPEIITDLSWLNTHATERRN